MHGKDPTKYSWPPTDCFPQDVKSKMFISSPRSLSNPPFPNSYTMRVFIIFLFTFCHALAWKNNVTVHKAQAIARVCVCIIQSPYNCWWSYSSAFHTVLPDFQCSFSRTNSVPLYCVRLCKPRDPVPCLWITPNPGNLRSTKKGTWG